MYKISHLISKPLLKNLPETLGGGGYFLCHLHTIVICSQHTIVCRLHASLVLPRLKAFRYGTRSQGISQFYLHTPRTSANGMNHTCLCLPSRNVYNERIICDCDGAEILSPEHFIAVCELTSVHYDIFSTETPVCCGI